MIGFYSLSEISWMFVIINGVMGVVNLLGGISHIRNKREYKAGKFLESTCYYQRWLGIMDCFRGLYLLGCVIFIADKPEIHVYCYAHFSLICFLGGLVLYSDYKRKAASVGDVVMNFGMSVLTLYGLLKSL